MLLRIIQALFKPIDIAPLVFFRIVGGGLIAIETIGELVTSYHEPYLQPNFHFSYYFFDWLSPWPPVGMHLHFIFNITMAIGICLGFYYRWACLGYAVGAFACFMMEKSVYINHTYLYCLLALLMAFIPANKAFSLDAKRNPQIKTGNAQAWHLYLLRFQMAIVYFYAGIAKINADWLMGYPLKIWLPLKKHYFLIGALLEQEWWAMLMSYGGVIFDCSIVLFLLWPRTRKIAVITAIAFHFTNVCIFGVGTFPWLSMALTALFLPPSFFRNRAWLAQKLPPFNASTTAHRASSPQWLVVSCLSIYALVQIAIPARQWLYEGNASWHEAGHNFSWHMMLRGKTGTLNYTVKHPSSGTEWQESPHSHLHPRQYQYMIGKPDCMLEFAHYLASLYEAKGYQGIEVYATCKARLNGRKSQEMIEPNVDLAREERHLGQYDWVLPLTTQLPTNE